MINFRGVQSYDVCIMNLDVSDVSIFVFIRWKQQWQLG